MAVYNEGLRPPVDTSYLQERARKDPVEEARDILSTHTRDIATIMHAVRLLDDARIARPNDQEIAPLLLRAYALCDELH